MPEIIIEQNKELINYINMLDLPYSDAIKNHMINTISGIMLTEGNKTVSALYSKVTCNRHRSTGSRFLGEYNWNSEYVDYKRLNHCMDIVKRNISEDTIGFLIVDDTLSKKDKSTKNIEGLQFHNSHADGNRPMWSHCTVTSHYKIDEYSLPLNYKLYLRKDFFGSRAKKYFKNKQELAVSLIDEFMPVTEVTYLLIDAWYTSGKVMLHGLSKGYHTIGRIKSNRVIYPGGIKTNINNFSKLIHKDEVHPVTVDGVTYYVYRYEGKISDIENTVILFSWTKKDLSDQPIFIVCTDVSLDGAKVIEYYQKRWDIETAYRYHKTSFGFDEYQVQSLKSIQRFWSMVYMTYTFLELFRVSKRKLKLVTLGDTIGYFRKQHLATVVKYAYNCAENGIAMNTAFANLGLVA